MILESGSLTHSRFTDFSNLLLSQSLDSVPVISFGTTGSYNYTVDDKKLPSSINLISLSDQDTLSNVQTSARSLMHDLTISGSSSPMLSAYYPSGGYIDWHTNSNDPGYNLICTYSSNGNSFFEYYDLEDEEVVRVNDQVGWNYKIVYFGTGSNKMWHRAVSNCDRITFTFSNNSLSELQTLKNSLTQ